MTKQQDNWKEKFEERFCVFNQGFEPEELEKFIQKELDKAREEEFDEGERSMARGVLRRIEKGKSIEHIKILCIAMADKKIIKEEEPEEWVGLDCGGFRD